jgi:hypothetical protein
MPQVERTDKEKRQIRIRHEELDAELHKQILWGLPEDFWKVWEAKALLLADGISPKSDLAGIMLSWPAAKRAVLKNLCTRHNRRPGILWTEEQIDFRITELLAVETDWFKNLQKQLGVS